MDTLTCLAVERLPHFWATFKPRPEYKGAPVMPGLLAHAGSVVKVRLLWRMTEGDPYPGEWAVGSATDEPELFGRAWIASGDFELFLERPATPLALLTPSS